MSTSWVVTANAGVARFFSKENQSPRLKEIHDMGNGVVHDLTEDTESDRIGQRAASKSRHNVGAPTQPSGYQPNQTPAQHTTELFARRVAEHLLHGYREGQFKKLILVASPEFLGVLRQQLDSNLSAALALEINKDYTHANVKDLSTLIAEKLH